MNTKPWLIAKPLICCPVCGVSFNPRIMVYNKQFDATSSTNIHLSQTRCQNDSDEGGCNALLEVGFDINQLEVVSVIFLEHAKDDRLDFEDFPQIELFN